MPEQFDELSPASRLLLGELIAGLFASGTEEGRRRIGAENPKFAGMLDSVLAGLDAWQSLSPNARESGVSEPSLHLRLHGGSPTGSSGTDREDLPPGRIVVPSLDSRLARGFEVVEMLGKGGSGIVYRAKLPHEVHGRPDIALKLLRRGDSLDISKRLRDAQILKGLDHPNLVRVYAAGESLNLGPFVATEYVEGCNLRDWLREHGSPGERVAARVGLTLARALDAAHGEGVVHCDVKPDNVFGCRGAAPSPEDLKLGDFGLARPAPAIGRDCPGGKGLATGGTLGYMAPEQYWGACDLRSDIYALGGLLLCVILARKQGRIHFLDARQVEALAGLREGHGERLTTPQRRERVLETFREAGLLDPTGAVEDPRLRWILAKCLAFEPGDRYRSAAELAEDLGLWLAREPIRHAGYRYRKLELLRMLLGRCRDRGDVADHSRLWGLICLVTGPMAIGFSCLGTSLTLAGFDPELARNGTGLCYIASFLVILIPTLWITRGRGPVAQLFGYMLIFLAAHTTMRYKMGLDHALTDAIQVLVMGVIFGCMGLGSRHWAVFLYLGLALIGLAWPVSVAARQPWYGPYGPALMGTSLGAVLIAFGVSCLHSPPDDPAKQR